MKIAEDALLLLRATIVKHCLEIEGLFGVPVKVSVLVRDPKNREMEVLVTSDDEGQIIEAVHRARGRPSAPPAPSESSLTDDADSVFRLKTTDRQHRRDVH